jgi:hypothetical protein
MVVAVISRHVGARVVQRVLSLPMQLLVDVDLSAMIDCCSAALGLGGIIHEDSDGEPTGGKRSCAKDGLGGVAHGIATAKPSVAPTLVSDAVQQDDVVAPQLALLVLPIGMTTTPMVMV